MNIGKEYASFLNQFEWNYFITCRTPYSIYTMTVRNWITKLLQKTNKVEQVFYVSERDKGDYNNTHVHMLIGTNTDITYKEIKYGMGNISVGDYQPIYDSETACNYVTKYIGKDVDYDIIFKS
jgi:hypothetical protein